MIKETTHSIRLRAQTLPDYLTYVQRKFDLKINLIAIQRFNW